MAASQVPLYKPPAAHGGPFASNYRDRPRLSLRKNQCDWESSEPL